MRSLKSLLAVATLLLTITNANQLSPLMQRVNVLELYNVKVAGIECFDRHPILKPQASKVETYINVVLNSLPPAVSISAEVFADAVYEIEAFRKNVAKLCGGYLNNTINDAYTLTEDSLYATYELLEFISKQRGY